MQEMLSPEAARALVLENVSAMPVVEVDLLDAVGRVAACDLLSDMDVAPFDHSAMDGFAVRSADIASASPQNPVVLDVIAEEPAGSFYEGPISAGQCIRIMTGAPLPADADAVVKYEIVDVVEGDGRTGSRVSFSAPTPQRSNVRDAGEEAKAGEVVVRSGEVIGAAGVGFLASCGVMRVPTYARPKVAVMATGSELVPPMSMPAKGQIRDSNSYAMAACVRQAGCEAILMPIVEDTEEALETAVKRAVREADFVVTTGGAANGDYDFIKRVVDKLGTLHMATVNMRPGKAQTFGVIEGVPVFGLPGNPAAAYIGFEMLIRPALRKMQGYSSFDHQVIRARLSKDVKKRDPRRIYLRSTLTKDGQGYLVTPAQNQSSGLFGVIQRTNCLAIMPEGLEGRAQGSFVDCIVLDIPEEMVL
ncbi:MAG: molybdopterin molybdotransferase MoeA [Eggerthellaceae bacterium]|nr:molybdopterin molybdotransferase MoeA [Eggerthellaceae bacterium]